MVNPFDYKVTYADFLNVCLQCINHIGKPEGSETAVYTVRKKSVGWLICVQIWYTKWNSFRLRSCKQEWEVRQLAKKPDIVDFGKYCLSFFSRWWISLWKQPCYMRLNLFVCVSHCQPCCPTLGCFSESEIRHWPCCCRGCQLKESSL